MRSFVAGSSPCSPAAEPSASLPGMTVVHASNGWAGKTAPVATRSATTAPTMATSHRRHCSDIVDLDLVQRETPAADRADREAERLELGAQAGDRTVK